MPDETPFDPIGVQVGAFNFKPAIELTGGYDNNPARTSNPTPSWYTLVAPELKFNSNWARHEFTGDLRGSYIAYRELPSEQPAQCRCQAHRPRRRHARHAHRSRKPSSLVGTDNPGSPNIQAGLAKLPIFTTWGGTAGLGHRFNRFDVTWKNGAERTVYQDSTFTDGTTSSNEDRNYNRYFTLLRGSYELTPGMKPFVEVGADKRVHDLEVDFSGEQRNSDRSHHQGRHHLRVHAHRSPARSRVGWLDAQLPGSDAAEDRRADVRRLARPGLRARSPPRSSPPSPAPTRSRVVGVSGAFTREVALQVDHAFRRWLVATAQGLYGNDDYVGSPRDDNRYSASAALTYKLTRELWLKSEYRHDWLRSSVPGSNYDADVILLTLRAQR